MYVYKLELRGSRQNALLYRHCGERTNDSNLILTVITRNEANPLFRNVIAGNEAISILRNEIFEYYGICSRSIV